MNQEMYLHLDAQPSQYNTAPVIQTAKGPLFSFFRAPISNTVPLKSITVLDAYRYITGHYALQQTETLRATADKSSARIFKAAHFDYATFSGEFSLRSNSSCIRESGLLCIDFDHVPSVESLSVRLLNDSYFETALLFRSPSGDGVKWIIEARRGTLSHSDYFRAVASYITEAYGTQPDKSGKDIARACFLPYDPNAYINPNYR